MPSLRVHMTSLRQNFHNVMRTQKILLKHIHVLDLSNVAVEEIIK